MSQRPLVAEFSVETTCQRPKVIIFVAVFKQTCLNEEKAEVQNNGVLNTNTKPWNSQRALVDVESPARFKKKHK